MKVTYTLKGRAKHGLMLGKNEYFVLSSGQNTITLDDSMLDEVQNFLSNLKKQGLVEFQIQGGKSANVQSTNIQDDQKALKQSLLKDAKDLGLNVANTMSVEAIQAAINKHLEQATAPQATIDATNTSQDAIANSTNSTDNSGNQPNT